MSPDLQKLADEVTASKSVMQSATTLINGFASRIQTAVQEAIGAGATADELKSVSALGDEMKAAADALANAVQANTPSAPPS